MSKSTPISSLPNIKNQNTPAFEERENALVKEILSEIDNKPQQPPSATAPIPTPSAAQTNEQINQQMMEQQMMEQQMMEQQQLLQQQMMNGQESSLGDIQLQTMSLQDKIIAHAKQPLLVGAIVAILSLPFLNDIIVKLISSKEALKKFLIPLTLMIKAILGGGLFFGVSNTIQL